MLIAPKNKRQFDCSWLVPEIKNLDRWLVCDLKGTYAKKPTKAIAGPGETERDRLKASWDDPANQTSFDVAVAVADRKGQGLIFALPADGSIAVVDLDECFDSSGSLRDWAEPIVHQALVDRLIVERSVSGTGAHIWFTKSVDVQLSDSIPARTAIVEKPKPAKPELVESWDRDRAIALGAGLIDGSGTELLDGSAFVAWLRDYLRKWTKPTAKPSKAKPSSRPSASGPHRRVTASELRERLGAPATGNVTCPAHNDRTPSLSIDDSPCGTMTWVKCHAGCSFEAIVAAIPGLRPSDLFESPPKPSRKRSQAEPIEHDPDDPRPVVELTADEHIGTAEIMRHLAKLDDVFVHDGNVLVRVGRDDDRLVVEPLRKAAIRLAVSRSVRVVGVAGDRILPPNRIAEAIEASVDPNLFRRLRGVTQVPTMRADGTILSEPGFDPSSGLFYDPVRGLKFEPVPDKPSRDDARAAMQHLGELLIDFPLVAETDKDAWIAMVCSLACRRLFDLVPVFGITGRYPGSGKGRLVQIAAEIAIGHEPGFRDFGRDPTERKKELASSLSMGDRVVAFDNLTVPFADDAVAIMATATRFVGRPPYGQRREFDVSGVTAIVVGNSLTVGRDFVRRVVLIRLGGNPGVADREENTFRIRDIRKHVRQHRGAYLRSALTIVRAYLAAGRPSVGLIGGVGSFEQWSGVIRSAIVWAGGVDFVVESKRSLRESNVDSDEHELVLEAVAAVMKSRRPEIEAKQIVDVAELEKDLSCRALITELRGRRIGTVLRHWKDVEHGDGRVLRNRQRKGRGSVWWVEGGSSPDEPDETV